MATLQARNVPDEIYAAAKARAKAAGVSLSEYVIDVLRRETAKPTVVEWARRERAYWDRHSSAPVDSAGVLDEVRGELGE